MGNYTVTSGVIPSPVKVVIYGPEGIGKTTFASAFPTPLWIDTEGSSKQLNVDRLPKPTSWAMLRDEVDCVRKQQFDCSTLVIDTADWAEALCIRAVCDRASVKGIEDFGYGKGYTYVKEEFGRLLDSLEEVIAAGINVVITAHAQITKFEQPDEMGAYDRWTMKTSKQVAPLLREWCDMLLFANYKTIVVKAGEGKNAKSKAQGGRRVMYTTHHPCWDAKNRNNLPDELPFNFDEIRHLIPDAAMQIKKPAVSSKRMHVRTADSVPVASATVKPPVNTAASNAPQQSDSAAEKLDASDNYKAQLETHLREEGVPERLISLMVAGNVKPTELQAVVGKRGYFPPDMPIRDYPDDFVDGCLIAAWDSVYRLIVDDSDIPF